MVANAATVFVSVPHHSQGAHVKNVSFNLNTSCAVLLLIRHCLAWLLLPLYFYWCVYLLALLYPGLTELTFCRTTYCGNNGSCVEDTIRNTSYCDCPDGYEGINCESAICKSCCLQFLGILLSINTDACTALFFCAISHHFALGNPPCSDVGGVCIANRCECFCGWTGEYCNIQGRKKIQSGAMYIYIYIYT